MPKKCPVPDKTAYPTQKAAVRAMAHGARGVQPYLCKCGSWHTTSQLRVKPKRVRR